jgi:hypothetical protein
MRTGPQHQENGLVTQTQQQRTSRDNATSVTKLDTRCATAKKGSLGLERGPLWANVTVATLRDMNGVNA